MVSPKEDASGPAAPRATTKLSDRYLLCGILASGGMATVHLGRLIGPAAFARTVAIKRLLPHFVGDPDFRLMLTDEARLASRIRHPNVVQVLDVVTSNDELFIVMEYVDGVSLRRLARPDRKIPQPIIAAIVCQVLHGLHAAHEATDEAGNPLSIVHRDVSPENVLVGADGLARVLDFGVAKATSRLQSTREGQLKGKLAYMAPEQLRGSATRQSDVFSAAILLWEGLAGRRLFRGDDDGETIGRVLAGVVEPPSSFESSIDERLEAIVMRGLEVDLERRWATAREMAAALEKDVRLATATEIGEWVESLDGKSLTDRRALVRAAESVESPLMAPFEPRSGRTHVSWATVAEGEPTKLAPAASGRRWPRTALAVGSLVATACLVGWIATNRATAWREPTRAASSTSSAEPAPAAPALSGTASAEVSAPLPAAPVPSETSAVGTAPSVAPRRGGPATPRPAAPSKPPKRGCDPPYNLGPMGEKMWLKQCL